MAYYVRTGIPGIQIWEIDNHTATLLGVTNPEHGAGTYFKTEGDESIWDAIRRRTPWFEPSGMNPFVALELAPGKYYPRMARQSTPKVSELGWYPATDTDKNTIALARVQLTTLARQLDRICQTVHPSQQTFQVFGHDIRNLLILACTEVENHWREVLKSNGSLKERYTTKDYVALNRPMKLDKYAVAFPNYPWIEPITPFVGWGLTGSTSQELRWYDAYNAVKHAREAEFVRGTLQFAFEAISACAIMMVAQFGEHANPQDHPELGSFIDISAAPTWEYSELYVFAGGAIEYVGFDGEPANSWSPVNYQFTR